MGEKQFSSWVDKDGDGMMSVGDEILYNITVCNNGYQNVKNLVLDDGLTDNNSRPLAYTAPFTPPGAVFLSSDQSELLMLELEMVQQPELYMLGMCYISRKVYIRSSSNR